MKVLQINAYNYYRGGSETVFFNTIDMLKKHGHDVASFTLKWPENLPSPFESYFPESKETRKGVLRPLKNIVNYFYHFEAAEKLEHLIREFKPDIAQIHLIWGQLTPSILTVLNKWHVPAVLTVHDFRIICPSSTCRNGRGEVCEACGDHHFTHCIANTCCKGSKALSVMMAAEQYFRNAFMNPAKKADGMVFVSDFIRDKHYNFFPGLSEIPSVRLYNLAKRFNRKRSATDGAESYLLYFGRLTSEKGLPTLVEAIAKLQTEYGITIRLKIAGRGDQETALRQQIDELKLQNIELAGFRTGADLHCLIDDARYVVLPSECLENNPLSVIEANAAGTPVIGASIGGIPEIISDGHTGFLFESGNALDFAKVLAKALTLKPEEYARMCSDAYEFATENFSEDPYYAKLEKFYLTVVGATVEKRGGNLTKRPL